MSAYPYKRRYAATHLLAIVGAVWASAGSAWSADVLAVPHLGIDGKPLPAATVPVGDLCGGKVKKIIRGPEVLVLSLPAGKSEAAYAAQLMNSGRFQCVSVDHWVAQAAIPNDPLYGNQWHLQKISAERLSDINPLADTVVAVVGSGVEFTHPDLAANMVCGFNVLQGLDQCGGGDVGDITTSGHDTRIAGIIGAVGNNGIGVAGVGWNLKVMPVRCTNATNGSALLSNLIAGITWAVNHNAKVVNVSYEGVSDPSIETTGAWARTQGANLVWAAGNGGIELSTFDHENVTIVGGTDQGDTRLSNSNYGRAVDVYAPATGIYTTRKGATYGTAPQGTSFAAPQVAAALAYLHFEIPGITPAQAEFRVLRRAADKGTLAFDFNYGWGRLNAAAPIDWPERRYHFVDITPSSNWYGLTYPTDLNDNGDIVGANNNFAIRKLAGQPMETLPSPWNEVYAINNNRSIVGRDYWTSGIRLDADGTFSTYQGTPGRPNTLVSAINNSGQVAGYAFSSGSDWGATLWNSPTSPTAIWGTRSWGTSIDDRGIVVGKYDNQLFAYRSATQSLAWLPNPRSQDLYGYRVTETDFVSGYHADSGGRFAAIWRISPSFSAPGTVKEYGPSTPTTEALCVNNNGDAVGRAGGEAWLFTGLVTGRFEDLLDAPLNHTNYATLSHVYAINNHGHVAGRYVTPAGTLGIFYAEAVDDFHALIDMGQLGLNQSYFGSIPPTVAAQILDSNGNPVNGGQFLSLPYDASTGTAALPMGSLDGSDYRLRFQVNPDLVPGFDGSGYLSRIYPPMDHAAMPSDTHFIPMQELIMGDCDGDNEVGPGDFGMLSSAFGTVDGDSNWNSHADIDGDGEVGPSDFGILSSNFGATGE